jgi:hypothetical protein
MNGRTDMSQEQASCSRADTLLLVDFKWLMAGQGWWLDMSAWGHDRAYTAQLLQCALQNDNETLRATATRLIQRGLAVAGVAAVPTMR